jgi:hypothetical protein
MQWQQAISLNCDFNQGWTLYTKHCGSHVKVGWISESFSTSKDMPNYYPELERACSTTTKLV